VSGVFAVRKWLALTAQQQKDNKLIFERITTHLGQLEKDAGNFPQSLNWLQAAQKVSETPDALQKQIDEIQQKIAAQSSSINNPAH